MTGLQADVFLAKISSYGIPVGDIYLLQRIIESCLVSIKTTVP